LTWGSSTGPPTTFGRQIGTLAAIAAAVLLGFLVATHAPGGGDCQLPSFNLGTSFDLGSYQCHNMGDIFLFVLLGALAHFTVDALKASRAHAASGDSSLHDWWYWVQVKQTAIIQSVTWLVVGLLGLAVSPTHPDWLAGFFVGYSIDSVADVFLQRFAKAIPSNLGALSIQSRWTMRPQSRHCARGCAASSPIRARVHRRDWLGQQVAHIRWPARRVSLTY